VPQPIDHLRADLARAERALTDLELSDDFAHVTGAFGRQARVRDQIARELAECERAARIATTHNPEPGQ
jgi:hypothetical protein